MLRGRMSFLREYESPFLSTSRVATARSGPRDWLHRYSTAAMIMLLIGEPFRVARRSRHRMRSHGGNHRQRDSPCLADPPL
jgi:hypothetical protein